MTAPRIFTVGPTSGLPLSREWRLATSIYTLSFGLGTKQGRHIGQIRRGHEQRLEEGSSGYDPRLYKDRVEYHDKVIGRLVDYLDEQGLGVGANARLLSAIGLTPVAATSLFYLPKSRA